MSRDVVWPVVDCVEARRYMHGGPSRDPATQFPIASIVVPWQRTPLAAPDFSGGGNAGGTPDAATPPTDAPPTNLVAGVIRIHAGGSAFLDSGQRTWSTDRGFIGGAAATTTGFDVGNTSNDAFYASSRSGDFRYELPVSNGTYTVTLLFCDPVNTESDRRVFDVSAEGSSVLQSFDIAASGGGKAAVFRSFDVAVVDGSLSLSFHGIVGKAIVSGIQVVPRFASGG